MGKEGDAPPEYRKAFEEAVAAAADHDFGRMVEILYECNALGALQWRLGRKFPDLSGDDLTLAVTQAVDKFAVKAAEGELIVNPVGFLFKTADWRALDLAKKRRFEVHLDQDGWDRVADEVPAPDLDDVDPERASQLFRTVYALIPQIGTDAMRAVIRYIVEAAERGEHVTDPEIAAALGMSPGSIGNQRRRGMDRLRTRMIASGYVPEEFTFVQDDEPCPAEDDEEVVDYD